MRVVIADPPAYTPPYDYALAAALARQGVDVRLLTSRFRFGAVPRGRRIHGRRQPLPRLDRTRLVAGPARGEGARASPGARPARPRRLRPAPPAVGRSARGRRWLLLHTRRPLVFTAHDLLPRRTASHTRTWKRLFGRFDRDRHPQRARPPRRSRRSASPAPSSRVIPHPAFRSDPARHDDGRTVLALGVIRPYKGLPDAIEAVARIPGARLLVAGDPRIPIDELRAAGGRPRRVAARLPGRGRDRRRARRDDRRRLPLPRRARPVRRAAAGDRRGHPGGRLRRRRPGRDRRRVRRGPRRRRRVTSTGLERALRELLDDEDALAEARAGARSRARDASPGTAPAPRICALYEELV